MNKNIILGFVFFFLMPFVIGTTQVETVPTGSIVGTIVTGMAFFCLIGYLLLKVEEHNKYKEGWTMLSVLFFLFAGFFFNILTFFIMKFSEAEAWYSMTRALFIICSVMFGFIGSIIAFIVTIITVIFFLNSIVVGKNEKKDGFNESRY